MLRFLTAGESHGPQLTVILEGIPAGLQLSSPNINHDLARRQVSFGSGARMRIEQDQALIQAGVLSGYTTGAPIAMQIENRDHDNWRGKTVEPMSIPRPGHVDLTAALKYGYKDLRPGLERGSARETAARVAAGAVCRKFLQEFDIKVGSVVTRIGSIAIKSDSKDLQQQWAVAESNPLRCPAADRVDEMKAEIRAAAQAGESVGGIIEVVAINLPVGLGSHVHWERRLSSRLGAAMFGIPAIKGMEIGSGFALSKKPGSQATDPIRLDGEELSRSSNHAGGMEGGISNGMPLVIRLVMKPIPTTLTPQASVNLATGTETATAYERSDFCAVPRAAIVAEAMICFVLADELIRKLGGDSLAEMLPRYKNLPTLSADTFHIEHKSNIFWPADEA